MTDREPRDWIRERLGRLVGGLAERPLAAVPEAGGAPTRLARIDPTLQRIAVKVAQRQRVDVGSALVPIAVHRAGRELAEAASMARLATRGDADAARRLYGKLGGDAAVSPRGTGGGSTGVSPRMTVLMGLAGSGPVEGLPCGDEIAGDLDIAYGAYACSIVRPGTPTRAHGTGRRLHPRSSGDTGSLRGRHGPRRSAGGARRRRRSRIARFPPWWGRRSRRHSRTAWFPSWWWRGWTCRAGRPPRRRIGSRCSRSALSRRVNLASGGLAMTSTCASSCAMCVALFEQLAAQGLADETGQLVGSIVPSCFCAATFAPDTVLVATPRAGYQFPADRADYRLFHRSDDITDRIESWAPDQIRFRLPPRPQTGAVYLWRPVNTMGAGVSETLSNLCGVPSARQLGANLRAAPGVVVTFVRSPVIEAFTVDGSAGPVAAEACRAVRLDWRVALEGARPDDLLPPCAGLAVTIRDGAGAVLHQANDAIGAWYHNTDVDITYRLAVVSTADGVGCGEAASDIVEVHRERRVRVEPSESSEARTVAGRPGSFIVRLSCPAPAGGAVVALRSSDAAVLVTPPSVSVLPGETAAIASFSTPPGASGVAIVTATLAGHTDGQLRYEVVEHLTAIVLSGGGAKGSFEVGVLLYLYEIWNDISPRIVCGTSVGAINALGVAEATNGAGIDKIRRIWLGLEHHSQMYRPSPELATVLANLGIDFDDVVAILAGSGGSLTFDPLAAVDEGEAAAWAAAGWALSGPVGAVGAALASIFSDAGEAIGDVLAALRSMTFLLDLAPTEALVSANIDPALVRASGMRLRLAVVALEDGGLAHVTEDGQLMRERNGGIDALTTANALIAGTMASAAIPGIFEARRLSTTTSSMLYVDGGVREVLPTQAAVDLGAQLIYNIAAAPFAPEVDPSLSASPHILAVMKRGVDLCVSEVSQEEKAPRAGFCDGRERVLIQPNFEVHDTIEIHPGLIRINMAYGYLRAFEAEALRRGTVPVLVQILSQLLTDELAEVRRQCVRLEASPPMRYARATGFFTASVLETIRQRKNRIAEITEDRFAMLGETSFPRRFAHPAIGNQAVLDWSATWERHPEPLRSFLDSVDLWAPQIVAPGVAAEDGGRSTPPVRETAVTQRYVLPAAVTQALTNR